MPSLPPNATVDPACPLCLSAWELTPVRGADQRGYFYCPRCWLISADARSYLSRDAETAHYRTHENSIANAGYVTFLQRVINPLRPYLQPGMRCLDFGCGPGQTLSQLVRQAGVECEDYDPIFQDVPLNPPYDVVFATECLEHFQRPAQELRRIAGLLRPGGYLGIMTETWSDLPAFSQWYYTRDPTHVAFYHSRTLEWICHTFGFASLPADDRRVHILRRLAATE